MKKYLDLEGLQHFWDKLKDTYKVKTVVKSETNGNITVNGTDIIVYAHPTTTAKAAAAVKVGYDALGHVVTGDALAKADVGLGNVDNTADADKYVKGVGTSAEYFSYSDLASLKTTADAAMPKAGGTFTGMITLPADTPTAYNAVTKWYVDDSISTKLSTVLKFKGTKDTVAEIQAIKYAEVGDVYICTADNSEWVCTKKLTGTEDPTAWEKFGTTDVKNALYKDDNVFVDGQVLVADGTNGKVKAVSLKGGSTTAGDVNLSYNTTSGKIEASIVGLKSAAFAETTAFDAAGAAATAQANAYAYTGKEIDNLTVARITPFDASYACSYIEQVNGYVNAGFRKISISYQQLNDFSSIAYSDIDALFE